MDTEKITNDVKAEVKKGLDRLTTLRDEAKVHLHLASLDAKQEWEKLEPRIDELQAKASDLGETSRATIRELIDRAEGFVAKLRGKAPPSVTH
jgi:hypothetical protein